jgi:XTP/dITP diphosphohydrolase
MKKLFIASKNSGKIKEIKAYLSDLGIEIFSLLDLHSFPDIAETGKTFEENAFIKAKALFDIVKLPVLADDSGLEVDALSGAPGVYSARYAEHGASDSDNIRKLLDELKDVQPDSRTARFKCIIVLYDGITKRSFEGACEGRINDSTRGDEGFGYDPVFVPNGYEKTFAELGIKVKNKLSHRAKALKSLLDFLIMERSVN